MITPNETDPRGTFASTVCEAQPVTPEAATHCPQAGDASLVTVTASPIESRCASPLSPACSLTDSLTPSLGPIQPVADVPSYLDTRRPVRHHRDEPSLFITLPDIVRARVNFLLGDEPVSGPIGYAQTLIKGGLSVRAACDRAFAKFVNVPRSPLSSVQRFRAQFDAWAKSGDWVSLVNRAQAGPKWQVKKDTGLPDVFVEFCEQRISRFARADGKRQAWVSIVRQWRTGRNPEGNSEPIPGYGQRPMTLKGRAVLGGFWQDWAAQAYPGRKFVEAPIPPGWSRSNVMERLKQRGKFTRAVRALTQEGIAAAKEFLPQHLTSRADLRFLELVTFDDVRTDWLIFDPETGQPCELWLLVARDQATAMVLGFVVHPSRLRDDGTASHLGLQEMKELAAWLLEKYPLPPYTCTWRVERGTATFSLACAIALQEMLPGRIKLSYTSMIGGKSPAGYQEKAKGNSRGKASHESHNRLFHTQGSFVPGQTGAHYAIRPADLQARANECIETWEMRQRLPEHLRGEEKYSLLQLHQARPLIFQFCLDQNFRTDHALEGFEKVLEWLDPSSGKWMPQSAYRHAESASGSEPAATIEFRQRMESPVERAIKLMAGYQWTKVSPDVVITFLTHTIRQVPVAENGEVSAKFEGTVCTFAPPSIDLPVLGTQLMPGRKALAYFHPHDPSFLHLTNGKGQILGTWFRRARVGHSESELLAQAMRYTADALKTAQQHAAGLATDERARLDDIRAHNLALAERGNEFNQVTDAPPASASASEPAVLRSPVAAALASTPRTRQAVQDEAKALEKLADDARATLRKSAAMY